MHRRTRSASSGAARYALISASTELGFGCFDFLSLSKMLDVDPCDAPLGDCLNYHTTLSSTLCDSLDPTNRSVVSNTTVVLCVIHHIAPGNKSLPKSGDPASTAPQRSTKLLDCITTIGIKRARNTRYSKNGLKHIKYHGILQNDQKKNHLGNSRN